MSSIHNVAVILRLAGASGRDLLSGLSRYARDNCHWRMTVINGPDLSVQALSEELRRGHFDGVISSEAKTDGEVLQLAAGGRPLVIIGWHGNLGPGLTNVTFVRNDDEDIGRFGARYLRGLGRFRSFAFIRSEPRTYWALLREKGFQEELQRAGLRAHVLKLSASAAEERAQLLVALRKLPQPAAALVAYDELAVRVLDACREALVDVPRQMAVLGVDNDELLCDFSTPPLSSILPDHVREGEMAAAALARLLDPARRKGRAEHAGICREKTVVERASTATLAPAAHLVEEALRFIRANANRPLSVTDVARHLHVSRRLADLRFREFGGGTMAETIRKVRLARVAERLAETKLPIGHIAAACGYDNLQHLANAFRRAYGTTMTDYRSAALERQSRSNSLRMGWKIVRA